MPHLASLPWLPIAHGLTLLLALLVLLATLLPLIRATAWWIRVCDFPRLQIVAVAGLTVAAGLALGWHRQPPYWGLALLGSLVAAIGYQLVRIVRYTQFSRKQIADSSQPDGPRHLSLAVMNVLQYNQQAPKALAVLQAADPDIIMAVETNQWWYDQLKALEQTHPYTCHEPRENTYGLLFFSRLPLRDCEIKYLIDDDVPSLHAYVQLADNSTWVRLFGLHPKPPAPAESKTSTRRDAELLLVGKTISSQQEPTIVFGDMNDVAWSHTSELFQRISGLLDPRVGRGLLSTFHANYSLLRWPLDHVFVSPDFKVDTIDLLPHVGSDHFPIYVKLSYEPEDQQAQQDNCQEADADDQAEAREKIQAGIAEEAQEEAEEAAATR